MHNQKLSGGGIDIRYLFFVCFFRCRFYHIEWWIKIYILVSLPRQIWGPVPSPRDRRMLLNIVHTKKGVDSRVWARAAIRCGETRQGLWEWQKKQFQVVYKYLCRCRKRSINTSCINLLFALHYTALCSEKTPTLILVHNFGKRWLIFKILSHSDSAVIG